jgi:subtilisin family serine protease
MIGTSFAARFVTAAAAMLLAAESGLTAEEVALRLAALARDLGESGCDLVFGDGIVQAGRTCLPAPAS